MPSKPSSNWERSDHLLRRILQCNRIRLENLMRPEDMIVVVETNEPKRSRYDKIRLTWDEHNNWLRSAQTRTATVDHKRPLVDQVTLRR